MITLWALSGHMLWIGGLVLLLTIGSLQSWRRADEPRSADKAQTLWLALGLLLVASGQFLIHTSLFERSLWAIIALILAGALGRSVWSSYQS